MLHTALLGRLHRRRHLYQAARWSSTPSRHSPPGSGLKITVEQEVGEGDLVVQYGVLDGTNTGQLMGMPATNKPIRLAWMDMHRIRGGQIVESWHLEDSAGMLQRLSVTPG